MKAKPLLFLIVLLVFIECKEEKVKVKNDLWFDETNIYLPVTAEWTNRVEVADINGDNKVDLLFANGGNYSTPGELENSRIFINQGPNQKFNEQTFEILGEKKFISRVIRFIIVAPG